MARRLRTPLVVLLAGALLAGCGGTGDPIPAASAEALIRGIDRIEDRVRAGECRRARSTLGRLEQTARELPDDVDPELRRTLAAGLDQLGRLVKTQCRQKRPKPEPAEREPEPQSSYQAPVAPEPEPDPEPTYETPSRDRESEDEQPSRQREAPRQEQSQSERSTGGDSGGDEGSDGGAGGGDNGGGGDDGGGGSVDP